MWLKLIILVGMLGLLSSASGWSEEKKTAETASAEPDSKVTRAIQKGLKWLAEHQDKTGFWEAGTPELNTGATGLTLLSFLETGFTHQTKDELGFSEKITKGLEYLLSQQAPDGGIGKTAGKALYNHMLGTYALAWAYLYSGDETLRNPVKKATQYIIECQNPGAGWRYQPKDGQSDASVTGWALAALSAAKEAGIKVPKTVFQQAFAHFSNVTDPQFGDTGYLERGGRAIRAQEVNRNPVFHPILTAVRIYNYLSYNKDAKEEPVIQPGASLLMKDLPQWDTEQYGQVDYCYWFWGTRAMAVLDGPNGKDWQIWKEAVLKALLPPGDWNSPDRWTDEGGKSYQRAINILTLNTCAGTKLANKIAEKPIVVTPELEAMIKQLISNLGQDDWQTWEKATKELIKIGEPAIKYLKESLTHPDPEVKLRAKVILEAIE